MQHLVCGGKLFIEIRFDDRFQAINRHFAQFAGFGNATIEIGATITPFAPLTFDETMFVWVDTEVPGAAAPGWPGAPGVPWPGCCASLSRIT
jgi:hypothetical protein